MKLLEPAIFTTMVGIAAPARLATLTKPHVLAGHPRKKSPQNFLGWQYHKRVPPPASPYKAGITENSSSSLDILGRKPCKTS